MLLFLLTSVLLARTATAPAPLQCERTDTAAPPLPLIAIAVAVTSRCPKTLSDGGGGGGGGGGSSGGSESGGGGGDICAVPPLQELALVKYLLPSLAKPNHLSCGFRYAITVGYDRDDAFYDTVAGRSELEAWFETNLRAPLQTRGIEAALATVPCRNRLQKPGPVFEVTTRHAFVDLGADFIFRVNDDTEVTSPFARRFVERLAAFEPPNVGVVGPRTKATSGGNPRILTHDFTHRTHMEIFGAEYYPRPLVDWWMDDWISQVYGSRRTMVGRTELVVHHTRPKRYEVDERNKKGLKDLVKKGKLRIAAYLRGRNASTASIKEIWSVGHHLNVF